MECSDWKPDRFGCNIQQIDMDFVNTYREAMLSLLYIAAKSIQLLTTALHFVICCEMLHQSAVRIMGIKGGNEDFNFIILYHIYLFKVLL